MKNPTRFKWWHGLLFYAGVQALDWGIRSLARTMTGPSAARAGQSNRDFYRSQQLPVFAPPGLVFPIAWSINSASLLAGGLHVLNLQESGQDRRNYLYLQSAAWLLFSLFNTAYFELRSPINAAAVTLAYSSVTAAALRSAIRMRDRFAILSLLSTASWLLLATPIALAVASWNRDEFWGAGPLAKAPPALLK